MVILYSVNLRIMHYYYLLGCRVEFHDVMLAIIIMIVIAIIYLFMTSKIFGLGTKTFNTGSKVTEKLKQNGENAVNMVNKEAPVYDINSIYSKETIKLIATMLGYSSADEIKCSNEATGVIKTTEHSIMVKGVIPNQIYCARIESQHAPDRPFMHPFFFLLFKEEEVGQMTYIHVIIVDSGEKIHYTKVVIRPDTDADETTIYFDKIQYLTGRNADKLDYVRAKLVVNFKRDEDKGEDTVYIVSYILGLYSS